MGGTRIALAKDLLDLLRMFVDHEVRCLVVGAYALAILGRPRATGDLDVWVEPTPENAKRTFAALRAYGAPLQELTEDDLATPGVVFQIGRPPLRIDMLTAIEGVTFASAWRRRVKAKFDGLVVGVLGRSDFIANKRATGRLRDLADVERLQLGPRRTRPRRRR